MNYRCDGPGHAGRALWRTDGTPAGTFPLSDYDSWPGEVLFLERPGLYFFPGTDPGERRGDQELWVTDGTRAGTRQLVDLNGNEPSGVHRMVELDPYLYFLYRLDGPSGSRTIVGRSDGTPAGTGPLPGAPAGAGEPLRLVRGDDEVFIFYRREDGVTSLWREGGPSAGPRLLAEGLGFSTKSGYRILGVGGDRFFFATEELAADWSLVDRRIWVSDGTPGGTHPIPRPEGFVHRGSQLWTRAEVFGERIYFPFDDGQHGQEPWVSDGTVPGTRMIADLCPGRCDWETVAHPATFERLQDRPLLNVGLAGAEEILVYDPETESLTSLIAPCENGCSVVDPTARDRAWTYLRIVRGDGTAQLWSTDGTNERTFLLAEFPYDEASYAGAFHRLKPVSNEVDTGPFLATESHLFFASEDADHGWELWAKSLPAEGNEFPVRPPGAALSSSQVPGFDVWIRITPGTGESMVGRSEPECLPETLCVSAALPGRSEVFVRIVGPKPNGFLWPTLVKFTTSTVEAWIEQIATGALRYYRLEGAGPGESELPGLFDRFGFDPD